MVNKGRRAKLSKLENQKGCQWWRWRLAFEGIMLLLAIPTILAVASWWSGESRYAPVSIGLLEDSATSSAVVASTPVAPKLPPIIATSEMTVAPHSLSPPISLDRENWNHFIPERRIALIHVGKSGGLTVRRTTGLHCRLGSYLRKTEEERQQCVDDRFDETRVLARQVYYYFHMLLRRPADLKQATSFLFVFRNPVDRLISSFRYSHPVNCKEKTLLRGQPEPWGCQNLKKMHLLDSPEYRIYNTCFPSGEVELFAQSTMSPFPGDNAYSEGTTDSNLADAVVEVAEVETADSALKRAASCRTLANNLARGLGPKAPGPHMYYNYEYYVNHTIFSYPEKEVLGIRTEYEWEDIKALDLAIGGTGNFKREGKAISHGSEHYEPAPISEQAYHKLCCILHDEIVLYFDILKRAVNLNETAKDSAIETVFRKCGIYEKESLKAWQQACHDHLERDKPHFIDDLTTQQRKRRKSGSALRDGQTLGEYIQEALQAREKSWRRKA